MRWDWCADVGACPAGMNDVECSGQGSCQEGECICDTGFYGDACESSMTPHDVLVQLFRSTGGQRWLDYTKWEDGQYCDWYGILCDDKLQPIMIKLASNNLDGTLPESLGLLPSLMHLDVSNNRLGGTVPATIRDLPNLKASIVKNNQLVGKLEPMRFNNATVLCNGNCLDTYYCSKGDCTSYPF